jgi:hypothetical protein
MICVLSIMNVYFIDGCVRVAETSVGINCHNLLYVADDCRVFVVLVSEAILLRLARYQIELYVYWTGLPGLGCFMSCSLYFRMKDSVQRTLLLHFSCLLTLRSTILYVTLFHAVIILGMLPGGGEFLQFPQILLIPPPPPEIGRKNLYVTLLELPFTSYQDHEKLKWSLKVDTLL